MKPDWIVIHHSATPDNEAMSFQAIRKFHTDPPPDGRGWKAIAYQYVVENINGQYEILKGRMDNEEGAHARGFNANSIGICCVGDFDQAVMPEAQEKVLVMLTKSLMDIYSIPTKKVIGHRETFLLMDKPVEKSCPGTKVDMERIRWLLT